MKIVEQFKRRILDLAIRGKLVSQDPNNEPASELLARIKAEKEKLIKAGKIKKGKSSAVGSDGAAYEKLPDDVPFELPKGWVWCKLGDIGSWKAGATPSRKEQRYYTGGNIPWLKTGDLNDGVIDKIPESITPDAVAETSVRLNPIGSVLIAMYGATIGKIGVLGIAATTNQACCACVVADEICNKYLFYFLMARRDHFKTLGGGGAQPNISKDIIVSYPFPLPPIPEQRRIVDNIEELFKIADSLGEAADGLETTAKHLDKKILDLAIRGKLVPQNPNDEPASELLKHIEATSHKSPCKNHETPIEPPFEIPKSWEWVRLGNVSNIIRGTGIKRNETSESGVQCVRYGEIYTDYGYSFSRSVSHVPLAVAEKCHEATLGDVLCTLTGENELEIAKATAYLGKDRLVIGGDLAKITNHPYDPMLLVYFLFSPFMISQKAAVCTGGMIVHMGKSALSNLLIPLPPLVEQKRIVAKIEELRKVTQALTM